MRTSSNILAALLLAIPLTLVAAEQTATIKVSGNCGSCNKRIVRAAESVDGVKDATWNKRSKVLTAVYDDEKTTVDAIRTAVVQSGHDADSLTASSAAYEKLPDCCQYRTTSHD